MLIHPYIRLYPVQLLTHVKKMASNINVRQSFDYFLVLDFEATCDDKNRIQPQVESFPFYLPYFFIRLLNYIINIFTGNYRIPMFKS